MIDVSACECCFSGSRAGRTTGSGKTSTDYITEVRGFGMQVEHLGQQKSRARVITRIGVEHMPRQGLEHSGPSENLNGEFELGG